MTGRIKEWTASATDATAPFRPHDVSVDNAGIVVIASIEDSTALGDPVNVANTIPCAASNESRFITGGEMAVDSALFMRPSASGKDAR